MYVLNFKIYNLGLTVQISGFWNPIVKSFGNFLCILKRVKQFQFVFSLTLFNYFNLHFNFNSSFISNCATINNFFE